MATEADIPAMSVIRLAVQENRLRDPARITHAMYVDYLDLLGRGWVCERDGTIAGFACADKSDASIWALFVNPADEGLGIGKQLLAMATAYLFELGHDQVVLTTGPGTRADRFYAAQGWQRNQGAAGSEVGFTLARPR